MKYGERAERAYQLCLSGKTTEQIAESMGIKKMSVYGYIATAEAHHRPDRCEKCGLADEERGLDRLNRKSQWLCSRCMCPDEPIHAATWSRTESMF
jgi:hypothetical protein